MNKPHISSIYRHTVDAKLIIQPSGDQVIKSKRRSFIYRYIFERSQCQKLSKRQKVQRKKNSYFNLK